MTEKRSQYWSTMCDILDKHFPKGECKERGKAICFVSDLEMMFAGAEFDEDGNLIKYENNIKK